MQKTSKSFRIADFFGPRLLSQKARHQLHRAFWQRSSPLQTTRETTRDSAVSDSSFQQDFGKETSTVAVDVAVDVAVVS